MAVLTVALVVVTAAVILGQLLLLVHSSVLQRIFYLKLFYAPLLLLLQ